MQYRPLNSADTAILERYLLPRTESCIFLLSNLRKSSIGYNGAPYSGDYFAAIDNDSAVCAVLAHYWNGNIMAISDESTHIDALVDLLISQLARPIAGVVGPDQPSNQIINLLGLNKQSFSLNQAETLYRLNLSAWNYPTPDATSRYRLTAAADIDRALIANWLAAYEIEALGSDDNPQLRERVAKSVERLTPERQQWVLSVDGQPVSLSGFNASLPEVVQIGPVWTPPEYRNKGYARRLVAWTLAKAKSQGVGKAILFTDNPAAKAAYTSIGFSPIGSIRLALLKQPTLLR